jgi:hypothetical protein
MEGLEGGGERERHGGLQSNPDASSVGRENEAATITVEDDADERRRDLDECAQGAWLLSASKFARAPRVTHATQVRQVGEVTSRTPAETLIARHRSAAR